MDMLGIRQRLERLQSLGIPTEFNVYKGLPHVPDILHSRIMMFDMR